MRWQDYIKTILDSMVHQRVRALLTISGVVFGVAAVVAMTSISDGARAEIMDTIRELGTSTLFVQHTASSDSEQGGNVNPEWSKGLTEEDCSGLRMLLPAESRFAPISSKHVSLSSPVTIPVMLVGTTAEFVEVFPVHLTSGRFITRTDQNQCVAVLTSTLVRELFPTSDPLQGEIKIDDHWFTIIGIVDVPLNSIRVGNLDFASIQRGIYLPHGVIQKRLGVSPSESPVQTIIIKLGSEAQVRPAAEVLTRYLIRRHNGVKDTEVIVPMDLLKKKQSAQRVFAIVMGAIASISLLTGGIGIMNTMLSSVLERTQEIGVRRAMGAKRREVTLQFLTEALVLCLLGGVVGIIVGIALAAGITQSAGWRTLVGVHTVVAAITVSGVVGVVFGWWPAHKAANMDIINAIRYE